MCEDVFCQTVLEEIITSASVRAYSDSESILLNCMHPNMQLVEMYVKQEIDEKDETEKHVIFYKETTQLFYILTAQSLFTVAGTSL